MEEPNSDNVYQDRVHACWAGADLVTSAFAAAVLHYKRASVALPFPSDLFSNGTEKDFEAAQRAIDALPPMQTLLQSQQQQQQQPGHPMAAVQPETSSSLPQASRLMLNWLLAPNSAGGRRCPRMLRHIGLEEFGGQLRALYGPDVKIGMPLIGAQAPDYVFENLATASPQQPLDDAAAGLALRGGAVTAPAGGSSMLAWHGTSFERLHSIISTGLAPASGTRLQRNGAIHGEVGPIGGGPVCLCPSVFTLRLSCPSRGDTLAHRPFLWLRSAVSCATPLHPSLLRLSFPIIILPPDAPVQGIYLSTDYGVAWSFCSAAPAWRRSALGHKLRAVLVCQVDMELASRAGSADRGAAAATRWEVPEGLELRL